MNGPRPSAVVHTATLLTRIVAALAPGVPKRSVAQMSSGSNVVGCWNAARPDGLVESPPSNSRLVPSNAAPRTAASTARAFVVRYHGAETQVRRNGAATRSPSMSPCHQVSHVATYCVPGMTPARYRLVTPIVALTSVLINATPTSPRASTSRSRPSRKPGMRLNAYAPTTASSVLPSAIPAASGTEAPFQRLATSAPSATPGHKLRPNSSSAARDSPVAGHTNVAKQLTGSSCRPSRATAT